VLLFVVCYWLGEGGVMIAADEWLFVVNTTHRIFTLESELT